MDDPNNNAGMEKRRKMRRQLKFMAWVAVGFGIFQIVVGASLYMSFWNRLTNLQQSPYSATAHLASGAKHSLFAIAVSGAVPFLIGVYALRYLRSEPWPGTDV